jgi:hypothetical protein
MASLRSFTTQPDPAAIAQALGGYRSGSGWMARCPCHDDEHPSLSITVNGDNKLLVHCFAGCSQDQVIAELRKLGLWPEEKPRIVARYPYHDETGQLLYEVIRLEPKSFRVRRPNGKGGWLWSINGVRLVPYRLPELVKAQQVFITEGEKDADTIRSWGLVGSTNPFGALKWQPSFNEYFRDKLAVILPDNDDAGHKHAAQVARSLLSVAREVRIVEVPKGKDVSDWAQAGGTRQQLEALVRQAPPLTPGSLAELEQRWGISQPAQQPSSESQAPARVRIPTNDRELRDIVADALCALRQANDPPQLFCRAGELVRVGVDERGRHRILPVNEAYLRWRLAEVASFCRATAAGDRPIAPPRDVVQSILALSPREWQVPALIAITQCPVVRPDGTILILEGYDPQLQVYYSAQELELPAVPDKPTRQELDHALATIEDTLADFPFADAASRANTYAMLLTPLLRFALPRPRHFPLFVIDSPVAGTGKTLLAELVAILATGSVAPLRPAPREDPEWRKAITTALRGGQPLVIFDNVEGKLRSAELAAAITANSWTDRILGQTAEVTVPVETLFVATGVNLTVVGDLPRRSVWIRLDPKSACPWTGRRFRHPNLERWVLRHRGELLGALLTLIKAWLAQGRPKGQAPVLASFREWSQVVGGVLTASGIEGLFANCAQIWLSPETAAWGGFLQALRRRFGKDAFTTRDVVERLHADRELAAALPDELGDQPDCRRLGWAFRNRIDQRIPIGTIEYWVSSLGATRGCQRWRVLVAKRNDHA